MATDIVGSLFGVTPEVLQQRQMEMADRQAMEYAQLSPLQRASYGLARGGYQLAGALGGQDPQLRMISNRNAIARQIDPTNLESMQMGIQALQQAGDSVGAMQLAQVLRQAESEAAQRFQREAAGEASLAAARRERVQATPREIQLARELASQRGAPGTPEYQEAYNAELTRLTTTGESATPEMRNAAALASRKGAPGSPEYNAEYQAQLSRMTAKAEGREPTTPELTNARAFAATQGAFGSPEYMAAFNEEYKRLTTAKETREPTSPELTNARALAALSFPVGSPEYNAEVRTQLTRLTTKPEGREPTTPELTNARAIAARAGAPGSPEYEAAFKTEYDRLTGPKEIRQPTTPELTNARAIAARAGAEGSAEYNAAFMAEYNRLTQKEAQKPEIARLQALRDSYAPGSRERKEVQDRIDALGKGSTVEVRNILPGQPIAPKDWIQFEKFIQDQPTFKQTAAMISAAPSVLRVIRQSTSNDFASRALPTSIARLFEQGTLSNQDVSRYARTGGLDDRLAAMASEFFTGRVTSVTKEQAERFMTNVYRGALLEQRNVYASQADILGYADSPSFKKRLKQIDDELAKFRPSQPQPAPGAGAAPGAGTAPGAGGRTMSAEEEAALLRKYGQNPGQNPR